MLVRHSARMRFAGGKSNTPAMNDSVSARDTGLDRLPPQPIVCSANRALDQRHYDGGGEQCSPLRRVQAGNGGRLRAVPTAGMDGGGERCSPLRRVRGCVGDAAPYGGC